MHPAGNQRQPETPPIPPPAVVGRRAVVPVDIERLVASVRFDLAARVAHASATVDFVLEHYDGRPAFDLRQAIDGATFDGRSLPPEALAHHDLGAGPGAGWRAVDVECEAGSRHQLQLEYRLGTPDAEGAPNFDFATSDGVHWDFYMSDLSAGRYLEMWLPAGLCHDQAEMELTVELAGTGRPHRLFANGAVEERRPGACWTVRYPRTFTSLSPLLTLVPADEVKLEEATAVVDSRALQLTVAALAGVEVDLAAVVADATAWLRYFWARYGPWAHGERFLALLWGIPRGMEYDGATTTSVAALEHEIFHSWFGRGVKPARASDGWVDEAMAVWATASRRGAALRFAAEPLGLDEPPSLLCPPHPWSRYTPREAYTSGARLLSGVADLAGGPAGLRAALAEWHRAYGGRGASTEDLARHLSRWCGRDLSPWWDRYVYGYD